MNLAIITVSLQKTVILDLFASLEKQTNKNFKVFILDFSGDGIAFPQTSIEHEILHRPNKGYAYGVNQGVAAARKQGFNQYCVINDDTYVKEDFVEKSIERFALNPESLFGGKIYYAPGFEYHKDRYKATDQGNVLWYAGGLVDWDNALTPQRGVDAVDEGKYNHFQETEFITGCLIFFDKDVVNHIGKWDESYFLYFEDSDFCERAKKKGVKLYYDPAIVIWHKISQSTGGSGSKIHVKYQSKNRVKWGLKYAPWRTKAHLVLNYLMGRG